MKRIIDIFGQAVNFLSDSLWNIFLPFIIIATLYVNYRRKKFFNIVSKKDTSKIEFHKVKNSLSISLSSKIGTGAVIGVLAAMWQASNGGAGGESIVLWVIIGMLSLVPVTYSEVFLTQIAKKTPRKFIDKYFNKKAGAIYSVSLAVLYSFGFTGFQMTGIQSVINIFTKQNFNYQFTSNGRLLKIILPLVTIIFIIVLTKSYKIFINVLGIMQSFMIIIYLGFFIIFVFLTRSFVSQYLSIIWKDFLTFRTAATGIPIGFIVGFQRIIQTSETGLGTSAMASSDMINSPRREAMLQVIAAIITIFNAVIVTSYIFTYGRYHISGVILSGDGIQRIGSYLNSVKPVAGYLGQGIVIAFFLISGFTTILSSHHFINKTINASQNKKLLLYMLLIFISGLLSVSNFNVIFDAVNLLMFLVAAINIGALFIFVMKYIKDFDLKSKNSKLENNIN